MFLDFLGRFYSQGRILRNATYLNHIFIDETEAEDYLNRKGLKLHKAGQSNSLSFLLTYPQFLISEF